MTRLGAAGESSASVVAVLVLVGLMQAPNAILVLSGRSQPGDRIAGLDLGADDYLAKPFALEQLIARIRAIRRRVQIEKQPLELRVTDLVLDAGRHSSGRVPGTHAKRVRAA